MWGKVKKLSKKFNNSREILNLYSLNCCGVFLFSSEFFLKALSCKHTVKNCAVQYMRLWLWAILITGIHASTVERIIKNMTSFPHSGCLKLWRLCCHTLIILLSYSIIVCSTYVACLEMQAPSLMLLIRRFPFNAIATLISYAYTPTYAIIHQKDY